MKNTISWPEYVLIGFGILLLPAYFIGLILIGWAIFRIGKKMEKHRKILEKQSETKFHAEVYYIEHYRDKDFKSTSIRNQYSEKTLEDMK